jgi:hypothetical protein
MTIDRRDAVLGALAELPSSSPHPGRDALVRRRCHAVLTAAPRPRSAGQHAQRALDRLLPVAVVAYGVATVVEGLRLAGLI